MNIKGITYIGILTTIFFLLPSLAMKIWDFIVGAPWPAKSWLVYLVVGIIGLSLVRRRLRRKADSTEPSDSSELLHLAKERLVKGEISIDEFRAIRQEIKEA